MSCDLEVTTESERCWEKISSYITKEVGHLRENEKPIFLLVALCSIVILVERFLLIQKKLLEKQLCLLLLTFLEFSISRSF